MARTFLGQFVNHDILEVFGALGLLDLGPNDGVTDGSARGNLAFREGVGFVLSGRGVSGKEVLGDASLNAMEGRDLIHHVDDSDDGPNITAHQITQNGNRVTISGHGVGGNGYIVFDTEAQAELAETILDTLADNDLLAESGILQAVGLIDEALGETVS